MQLRTSARALAAVGVLALATTLSSCGFDYATDRVYTPAAAVNQRDASVDVLGAAIVSAQPGSGTFIASFSNNDQTNPGTVTAIAGAGDDSSVTVNDFSPITVDPGALVNLVNEKPITVSGEQIKSGAFVTLSVSFGDGESVQMHVPVYPPCNEFEGLDKSGSGSTTSDQCTIETPSPTAHAE